jgi:hypothetical protein
MTTKKSAGALAEQPASKSLTNILPQQKTGRELLVSLSANVADLCELVMLWRDEADALRERVAVLEQATQHQCECRRFSA